ncbi:MAG TPA: hypothetical protein PLY73_05480, partial [Candidatus Ozemobacteraceae bacterium]|nr:hypothetical protein [Candidatus Ozemobacteraceae bacterium]
MSSGQDIRNPPFKGQVANTHGAHRQPDVRAPYSVRHDDRPLNDSVGTRISALHQGISNGKEVNVVPRFHAGISESPAVVIDEFRLQQAWIEACPDRHHVSVHDHVAWQKGIRGDSPRLPAKRENLHVGIDRDRCGRSDFESTPRGRQLVSEV